MTSFLTPIQPYLKRGPLAVFALGLSSGFPLTLLLATLGYWLSKVGIEKSTVGLFALATTPYTFKFLWSPFLDRVKLPLSGLLGQRRVWLWLVQAALAASVVGLGFSDPVNDVFGTARWALVVAFLSASQDILIDAYRIEILDGEDLAYGSAMINFGYRVGNLIAGAGTIYLSINHGWAAAYALTALMVLPGALAALIIGEPQLAQAARADLETKTRYKDWLSTTLIEPFRNFFQRDGAVMILAFIALYKIGDAMANNMLSPLVVELGFSDLDVIFANKGVGFWALIAGTACGAPVLKWLGMARALFVAGLFMMLTNLVFAALAMTGDSLTMLTLAIGLENFSSGVGLTIFITYISGLCNLAFTGTQYALLSSFAALARTYLVSPAGYVAEWIGWPLFFVFTTIIAIPGLALLWLLWKRGYTGEQARDDAALTA